MTTSGRGEALQPGPAHQCMRKACKGQQSKILEAAMQRIGSWTFDLSRNYP